MNPTVTRVHTATGSHIEPPLDDSEPEIEKLRWHLAVALHDTGMSGDLISIREEASRFGRKAYALEWERGGMSPMNYGSMWTLINGISLGWRLAADRKADS